MKFKSISNYFGFDGLSNESINLSLINIGQRAWGSVPFSYILVWLFIFRNPEMRADHEMRWLFALINLSSLVRFIVWRYGHGILARKNGQLIYRALCMISALCIGIMYGTACAHAFLTFGFNSMTWVLMCGVLGAAATVIPALSFDVIVALTFESLMLGIPVVSLILYHSTSEAHLAAVAISFYYVLMFLLALSVRRTQIALYASFERLAEQEAALQKTHEDLTHTHNLIRAMLESIDEAFLLFNHEGLCTSAPSEKSKRILAQDPTDKHISEIVSVEGQTRENMSAWVQMLFLDRLEFDELAAHGPSRIQIGGSTLNLKYHPMRDEAGKMKALIFTAIDVTQEVLAEQQAKTERERADMILRILDAKANFQPYLQELQHVIQTLKQWNGQDVDTLRRELHTMKGGAMLFGAGSLAQSIYATEIAILAHSQLESLPQIVRSQGEILGQFFAEWQRDKMNLFLQLGVFADQSIEVSAKRLDEIEHAFEQDPRKKILVRQMLGHLLSNDLGELMREYEMHLTSTASKLGKTALLEIENDGAPILLAAGQYREVFRSFVHLFNNAVDHGLESPEDRILMGKSREGHITVRHGRVSVESKNWIRIEIEDDGGGINVEKLRHSLVERGEASASAMSDLEIAMCIFNAGLSTRDSVSELSGQGVGMGSVRAAIVNAGGKIRVVKTDSRGTVFEILLPDVAPPSLGLPPSSLAS